MAGLMADTIKPLFSWRGAICASDLKPAARHVALTLSTYMSDRGDSAHPGPALLARDTGLHISTVKEKLAELEAKGWIACVVRGGQKGERRLANEYEASIPDPSLFSGDPSPETPGAVDTRCPDRGDPSSSPRVPVAVGDPISSENSPKNSSKRATSVSDFEKWWSGWPRKDDKARARDAYLARRRQGITAEQLTAARDNYLPTAGEYVKYAKTFLHGADGPWSEYEHGGPVGAGSGAPKVPTSRPIPEAVRSVLGRGLDAPHLHELDENGNALPAGAKP